MKTETVNDERTTFHDRLDPEYGETRAAADSDFDPNYNETFWERVRVQVLQLIMELKS